MLRGRSNERAVELERSGLGLAENEIIEICNIAIVPKPDWNTKERLGITNWPTRQDRSILRHS